MTEEQARPLLAPYHDRLYACPARAFGAWRDRGSSLVSRPSASFRAQFIREHMLEYGREVFGDVPEVTIYEQGRQPRQNAEGDDADAPDAPVAERFLLGFANSTLLVQFKKFDSDFRTRNYPTATALRFDAQEVIDNVPTGTYVTVGYQVNETATAIVTIAVVCQGPYRPNWYYELEVDRPADALVSTSPLQPARVRPKGQMALPLPRSDGRAT